MSARPSDLLRGTIGRGAYAAWGIGLALVKYNVDRLVVRATTGKALQPFDYWFPGDLFGVFPLEAERARAVLPLAVAALPFVAAGVVLTLRRLRDVGLPGGAVLLFFVPAVNLVFFAILCALPSRRAAESVPRSKTALGRFLPDSAAGSAAVAIAIVVPVTVALAALSTSAMRTYGWGLFVGEPFFLGLAAAVLHGYHRPRPVSASLGVAMLAVAFASVLLAALAVEGVICIAMAVPIAAPLAFLGALVGHLIQARPLGGRDAGSVVSSAFLAIPALCGAEAASDRELPTIVVTSTVEVDAPPAAVWGEVVAFAELPPPTELLFRAGVAYPLRAEMHGTGVGAVRHCVFSTGPFVEPIEVWDAPRRLEFGVVAQPPSMRELSPYPELSPPHLEGFLASSRGRFELVPLPGNRTRLEGTTWYSNRMWPASYWRIWSDAVIHRIHLRVLRHVRDRAERAAS